MPLPLDVLLFWVGLGITLVGLVVFLMGRALPDTEKKGANKFEAFGIKIDVSNPSLLLVILGVVLMLVPKMVPHEVKTTVKSLVAVTPQSQPIVTKETSDTKRPERQIPQATSSPVELQDSTVSRAEDRPSVASVSEIEDTINSETVEPESSPRATKDETQAQTVPTNKTGTHIIPAVAVPKEIGNRQLNNKNLERAVASEPETPEHDRTPEPAIQPEKPMPMSRVQPAKPGRHVPAPTPIIAERKVSNPKPLKPAKARIPKQVDDTSPVTNPESDKRQLVVLARADVDSRAGILRETRLSFSEKVTEEMANQAESGLNPGIEIRQERAEDVRSYLKGANKYQPLCARFDADLLFIGDLSIPFAMSNVESAYWPDITLHIVDCGQNRSRKKTKNHLDPRYNDRFPFQMAISEVVEDFIVDNRNIVGK